jgi:hypothetical protein
MNTNSSEAAAMIDLDQPGIDLAEVAIAGGSVVGREHRRLDRNNQDAFAWDRSASAVVAVVCDGCGSGRRSEVGAALGARLWTVALLERLEAGAALDDQALWRDAGDDVLRSLGTLAAAMGGELASTITEHFLFTTVVAAFTGRHAALMAIGDGVIALDGDVSVLGPFEGNRPPYLAYGLVGATPPHSTLIVRDADKVTSLVIGSDGAGELIERADERIATGERVGGLAPFWRDERFVRNPDAVRRRLAVLNQEAVAVDSDGVLTRRSGLLADDTTIVVLRRMRGGRS